MKDKKEESKRKHSKSRHIHMKESDSLNNKVLRNSIMVGIFEEIKVSYGKAAGEKGSTVDNINKLEHVNEYMSEYAHTDMSTQGGI
jgi:hypothetical protein